MNRAEFDDYAADYEKQHRNNISLTGEEPEFFARYKVKFVADVVAKAHPSVSTILDFGSGIGNSLPHFRDLLQSARLTCAEISPASISLSQKRFPGPEQFALIEDSRIPLASSAFDLVFSSCVFHHIAHEEHETWLRELLRVTRPGGRVVIFEHNPFNPLTVNAVRTCPFDTNARLIRARKLAATAARAGWGRSVTDYHVFFPRALAHLRPLEPSLSWLPLGAQYSLVAQKP